MRHAPSLALVFCLCLVACPRPGGSPDAGVDGVDGGGTDAGSVGGGAGGGGGLDAGSPDAGGGDADGGAAENPYPDLPPLFFSGLGLSYDGPVADGGDVWVELTIAHPDALAALGGWRYQAANHSYVNLELVDTEVPFTFAVGDRLRIHGATWTGTTDTVKSDNQPAVWDVKSAEPFGPSFKHGVLWLEAVDGTVLDAVVYETNYNQLDWMTGDALIALDKVVAAGEWTGNLASDAVFNNDTDRYWGRLHDPLAEGDQAADWQVVGATLDTYYETAVGKTGAELKAALHEIIKGHDPVPYADLKSVFTATDPDPAIPGNVIQFYTGRSTAADYNREHVWAKSHGGFSTETYPAYSDLHHLRPTRPDVNSKRWHLDFARGGTPYSDSGCNVVDGYSFEPPDRVKGDVARSLFYMAVRYEGDENPILDLELEEVIPSLLNAAGQPDNNQHASTPRHGKYSELLEWHIQDPPDDAERARNEIIWTDYQKNRNPFIDHPEWVVEIW